MVLGVFLVVIGITAAALSSLVSASVTTAMESAVVGTDSATVRTFVNGNLAPADLTPGETAQRRSAIDGQLRALVARGEILRAELLAPNGTILDSDAVGAAGTVAITGASFAAAVGGTPVVELVGESQGFGASGPPLGVTTVLREYLPVTAGGKVVAMVAIWRDAAPLLDRVGQTQQQVLLVTLAAALITAIILVLLFRGAQARINDQTGELLDAERRDALTGTWNHGSLVAQLMEITEHARASDGNVTVALLDIDGFRLLNDTHGHDAGDEALLAVARLIGRSIPSGMTFGRYGPDEFLLVAPGGLAASLEPAVNRLNAALADLGMRFNASERLPVTVSAGIATYPEHADSVTGHLSIAALALSEAKASGGNAIRVANPPGAVEHDRGFGILQGLVIAVDTKDRYTKRHSADVSRYATFLADRLGLEAPLRESLRVAGLLHDVGKIGIPDDILRKPAQLTADEHAIMAQHVALGDAIVRGLPNIEDVRAAIRYHHERWDGHGYLEHLVGEEIPLIARIISVADVFSAMTTTRPYRQALSVEEALRRLGDAAGSQLDERLVRVFIEGIETAANPPLPGQELRPQLALASAVA
jgi:diguanylate cyclase (GGDEF)-like protein/putative nucleotidyltransferase with HDIG domain